MRWINDLYLKDVASVSAPLTTKQPTSDIQHRCQPCWETKSDPPPIRAAANITNSTWRKQNRTNHHHSSTGTLKDPEKYDLCSRQKVTHAQLNHWIANRFLDGIVKCTLIGAVSQSFLFNVRVWLLLAFNCCSFQRLASTSRLDKHDILVFSLHRLRIRDVATVESVVWWKEWPLRSGLYSTSGKFLKAILLFHEQMKFEISSCKCRESEIVTLLKENKSWLRKAGSNTSRHGLWW